MAATAGRGGDDGLCTYQELDQSSTKVARALLGLGVAPGDRVAVLAPKSAASVTGIYGVLKAAACRDEERC